MNVIYPFCSNQLSSCCVEEPKRAQWLNRDVAQVIEKELKPYAACTPSSRLITCLKVCAISELEATELGNVAKSQSVIHLVKLLRAACTETGRLDQIKEDRIEGLKSVKIEIQNAISGQKLHSKSTKEKMERLKMAAACVDALLELFGTEEGVQTLSTPLGVIPAFNKPVTSQMFDQEGRNWSGLFMERMKNELRYLKKYPSHFVNHQDVKVLKVIVSGLESKLGQFICPDSNTEMKTLEGILHSISSFVPAWIKLVEYPPADSSKLSRLEKLSVESQLVIYRALGPCFLFDLDAVIHALNAAVLANHVQRERLSKDDFMLFKKTLKYTANLMPDLKELFQRHNYDEECPVNLEDVPRLNMLFKLYQGQCIRACQELQKKWASSLLDRLQPQLEEMKKSDELDLRLMFHTESSCKKFEVAINDCRQALDDSLENTKRTWIGSSAGASPEEQKAWPRLLEQMEAMHELGRIFIDGFLAGVENRLEKRQEAEAATHEKMEPAELSEPSDEQSTLVEVDENQELEDPELEEDTPMEEEPAPGLTSPAPTRKRREETLNLRNLKHRKLIKYLNKMRYTRERHGKHEIFKAPGSEVPIPVPRGGKQKTIPIGTARSIVWAKK